MVPDYHFPSNKELKQIEYPKRIEFFSEKVKGPEKEHPSSRQGLILEETTCGMVKMSAEKGR